MERGERGRGRGQLVPADRTEPRPPNRPAIKNALRFDYCAPITLVLLPPHISDTLDHVHPFAEPNIIE